MDLNTFNSNFGFSSKQEELMLRASKTQWYQVIGATTALLQRSFNLIYKFENFTAGLSVRPFFILYFFQQLWDAQSTRI